METRLEPKLAPPGAGLPAVELFIARLLFGFSRLTGSREAFNARFDAERRRIRELVRSCDPDTASRRVLINRLRGLEDSSRNWSVWMTLDHLRIVNLSFAKGIELLGSGLALKEGASTAKVKPSPEVRASVVGEYEAACDAVLKAVQGVADLKTRVRYAHPWFGPLDAFGWHGLAAGHMRIHRAQIEAILGSLKDGRSVAGVRQSRALGFGNAEW
jgi:hypothetical protein